MFSSIKNWFRKRELEFDVLNSQLKVVSEILKQKNENALRPISCNIDLSDSDEEPDSDEERKAYCAAISAVFPRIEKDIKKFLYKQMETIATKPLTWEESLVMRGEFSGMDFLLEHWRKAHNEHNERIKPKEKFDETNPIPEI